MELPPVDLRRLAYFVAVAREGSYLEAARQLHLSQPALWRQVKALEKDLGLALFERVGPRVVLSAAGSVVLAEARRIMAATEQLSLVASDLRDGRQGLVRLGCFPAHVGFILARALGRFLAECPTIRLELAGLADDRRARLAQRLYEELRLGSLDLAMAPGPRPEFDGFLVYHAPVVAMFPAGHELRGAQTVGLADLGDARLLTAPPGYFSRVELERAALKAGVSLSVFAESSNPASLLALGAHGVGIPVVAQDHLAPEESYRGASILAQDGPIGTEVWLHWRRDQLAPAARRLVDVVRDEAARLPGHLGARGLVQ